MAPSEGIEPSILSLGGQNPIDHRRGSGRHYDTFNVATVDANIAKFAL